jgi:hypothetical protein
MHFCVTLVLGLEDIPLPPFWIFLDFGFNEWFLKNWMYAEAFTFKTEAYGGDQSGCGRPDQSRRHEWDDRGPRGQCPRCGGQAPGDGHLPAEAQWTLM